MATELLNDEHQHHANRSNRTESADKISESTDAEYYLNHLLDDGSKEGDSGAELAMPEWYNEEMFIKGQSYMKKYRFLIVSGMLSGLIAVLSVPSILRILICTRQSSTPATAYRRYVRTILHTHTWYDYSPKAADSKFWTSLRAVRKAHSRSSRACVKMNVGQITQKDLALTQFGFIGFVTLGAPRIQLYDQEFFECTSHMWRVLGHLLGIKNEYNICGASWAVTKQRLEIVMRKVYAPALEQTDDQFFKMSKALLDGLWAINTVLTVGSYLFFTKRLAYVKGYEYYDFDYLPGTIPDPSQKKYFHDLNWWDRFVVSYGLHLVTYLHKYAIVRWYLNFRVWLGDLFMYYLPYIAIFKYGIKWAYVRIFANNGQVEGFQFHLKDD